MKTLHPILKDWLALLKEKHNKAAVSYAAAMIKNHPKPVKVPEGVSMWRANYIKTRTRFLIAESDNKNYEKQRLIRYNPLKSLLFPANNSKKKSNKQPKRGQGAHSRRGRFQHWNLAQEDVTFLSTVNAAGLV